MGTGASTEELSAPAREELAKLSEATRKELEKKSEEKVAELEKKSEEQAAENEKQAAELEKLRAEIEKLRSPDKAPPTMKTTRSQSVVEAVAHVEAEARREEAEYRCRFYFLDAVQLRDLEGKTLPFYQELRRTHPQLFVERTVTFMEALQGELVEEYSTGSHRWVKADNPDPDGVQLAAVRKYLVDHPKIRYFWYDAWCMPQGEKTATEKADFKRMLDQVNLLYLGTSVLVLVDLSYPSRFWTQFEV